MEDQEQSDIHHTNITDISREPSHTKYNNNFPDLLRIVGEIIWIHYHDDTLNIRAEQKIQNNSNWICSLTIHHPTAHIIRPIRFQQRLERWQRYNVHQLQTRNLSKWVELKLIIIAKVWQAANGFWSRINHSQDSAGLRLGDELTRMGWNGERWITMDKIRVFQIKRLISEPLALFIIGSSF